ncbi:MAG: hypothetical protein HC938_00655, partial [Nitrospira sp.]|nr:hypothetical protein [Nitrospira sp.]
TLDQDHPTGHVTFSYENAGAGIRLEKRLTFHAASYVMDMEVIPTGLPGSVKVELGTNFGVVDWGEGFIGSVGAASLVDDKVEKSTPDSEAERKGSVKWAALQDKYFIAAVMPKVSSSVLVKNQGEKLVSSAVRMPVDTSGVPLQLQLFAGPKEYDTLASLQIGLEDTDRFRMVSFWKLGHGSSSCQTHFLCPPLNQRVYAQLWGHHHPADRWDQSAVRTSAVQELQIDETDAGYSAESGRSTGKVQRMIVSA